jgi:hypothetical protein
VKETRRAVAAFLGILAGAAAVPVGVIANRPSSPWRDGWLLFWVLVLCALVLLAAVTEFPDIAELLGALRARARKGRRPPKLYLGRWLYTSEGAKAGVGMSVLETIMPGTGHRRMQGERLPWARFAILIACSRVAPDLDTRQLWSRFSTFLGQPAARCVVSLVADTRPGMSWSRRGTRRAGQVDAVLTPAGDNDAVASARLDLPDDSSSYGRDNRCATLILHFEPPGKEGKPPPAQSPEAWEAVLARSLELAGEFALFLERDLGLSVSGEPPATIVFKLSPQQDIAEMIDATGLDELPGLPHRSEIIGYFIAGQDGSEAAAAAAFAVTDVLRYGLSAERQPSPMSP